MTKAEQPLLKKWTLRQWRQLPKAVRQPLLNKTLQEAHCLWAEHPETAPGILPGAALRWFPPLDSDLLELRRGKQWRVYRTMRRFVIELRRQLDNQLKEVSV